MHVGTNFELMAKAELVDNINSPVILMDSVTSARVSSKADKSEHVLNLGARQGENDAILSISYNADTKEEANEIAKNISITDSSSQAYGIKMYNPEYDANATENSETNANITYNSSTGKASLNVTFTHAEDYDKEWKINTPDAPADLLLYNVLPMAGIDSAEVSGSGEKITASWTGSQLEEFESISFMAVKNSDDIEGSLIYKTKDKDEIKSGATDFDIPDSLETGTYYLKVTAIKEGELCETAVSSGTFNFENTKLPSSPASISVVNGGDYQIDANVEEPQGSFDGYKINIYEKNEDNLWVLNEAGGMSYKKDAQKLSAGGRYSYTYESEDENGNKKTEVVTRGLEPGRVYKLGVSTYREDNSDPDKVLVYYSPEIMSDEVVLAEPQTASIEISAPESIAVEYSAGEAEVVYIDTYKSGNITFSAQSDQKVYGTWTLDGGDKSDLSAAGSVNNSDDWEIPLKGLEDGNHTITFIGTNNAGDGVLVQKRFAVDTLAPRLLLEAPLNGGFFEENGNVEIKGITDIGAKITINTTVYSPSVSVEDGSFSQTVNLDKTATSNEVTISASDEVGNTASRSITVINKSLGKVQKLKLYADGSDITNKSLTEGDDLTSQVTKQLILKAETSDGSEIVLNNSSLVSWDAVAASGSVSVDGEGTLTMMAGARGMVMGKLMVSDKGSMTAAAAFGVQNEGSKKDAGGDGPDGPGGSSGTKPVKPEEQPQTSPYDAFTDVEGHWAQEYIKAVVEKGLFKGVTENLFAPEQGMTRGMFVTVLGRMENTNMHDSKTMFVDVDSNMYYAPYVTWATEQNIVKGSDGNRFLPEILISREQISVLLYRYALQKGYNTETEKTANMEMFKDYGHVSAYAEEAMKWAVSAGIMQGGDDGGLHPSDNATRAEVAAMIIRFIDMYVQ